MGWAAAIPAIFNQHQNDARRRLAAGASGLQAWGDPAGLFGGEGSIWDNDVGGSSISPNELVNLNPGMSTLKFLFGKAPKYAKKYPDSPFLGLKDSLTSYMNPTTFGAGGPEILSSILGNPTDYFANLTKNLGFFDESIGTAREANETGLKTDGTAYFNEAIRQYLQNALPQTAEVAGLGVQSSGFQAASAKAAEELLAKASIANIDLEEAAKQRRLQAAPLLSGLITAREALPLNLAQELTKLFDFEASKPLDVFSKLFGMGSAAGPYASTGYDPYTGGTGAALATGLSGILQGLSNFDFGGSGGGAGDTAAHQEFVNSLFTQGGPGY